jgi:Ser/Thr protein kinase RdoA (MazF antagonist)
VTPLDIASRFEIPPPVSVEPFGTGLLHATHRVSTRHGAFVLQRLAPATSDAAIDDARVVGEFLASRGFRVPVPRRAKDGGVLVRDGGERWRLYPLIAGEAFDVVADPAMAREAGRIVGEMHRHLRELDYEPQGSIPRFHDTAFIVDELRSVAGRLPEALRRIAGRIADELPALIVDERTAGEPVMVIHGDLKISNLLFEEGRAVAVIDLDTLMRHFRLIDLGDAFRSWCATGPEDDPGLGFDADRFAAAVDGYARGWGGLVDRRLCLRATRQLAWELAARFLTDVVRDDYFGFDPKKYASRREHNVARALAQFRLGEAVGRQPREFWR